MTTSATPFSPELKARLSGRPLLLLLDIDGTLSPIAPRPEYAIVPGPTQKILNDLAATPDVHLVVVTGRAAEDGRRLVCTDGAWVIGNHGIEVAQPGRTPSARDDVAHYESRIADAALRASDLAADPERNGVLVENKRWTMSVHYRLAHPRIVPELVERMTRIAGELDLRLTQGKEVIELRPPIQVNKGTAALELAEMLGATHEGASILAAGDDRTDEDMFAALRERQPSAVTVRVGEDAALPDTKAEFSVSDTEEMRVLLSAVLDARR
jgi:trehalose 6-phosphate phosphatase